MVLSSKEGSSSPLQHDASAGLTFWVYALLVLPLLLAYGILLHFLPGMPVVDDYFTVVGFSLHYVHLPTAGERLLWILTSQHMEHRFVFEHALVAADVSLRGHVDQNGLILIGDAILLPLLGLLWLMCREQTEDGRGVGFGRLIAFLPVVWLLFGMNYAEGLNFPSGCLDYPAVIFFSFAALHLLVEDRRRPRTRYFVAAAISALLAYGSAPNGFLVGPMGVALLLWRRRVTTTLPWGRLLGWGLALACGLFPYLYRYAPLPRNIGPTVAYIPLFYLQWLGCAIASHALAAPVGLILLVAFAWSGRSGFAREHPSQWLCWAWIFASGVLVAVGRTSYGMGHSFASRYRLFSDLSLVFLYQVAVWVVRRSRLPFARQVLGFRLALAGAVVFGLAGDRAGWHLLTERRVALRDGLERYRRAPEKNTPLYFRDPALQNPIKDAAESARLLIRQAEEEKLVTLPEAGGP